VTGRPPWLRRVRRTLLWHRRSVAALLAAGSVGAGLLALAPPEPATVLVLRAAADLPAGTTLDAAHVEPVSMPVDLVPDGALHHPPDVAQRVLAGPVRRGEPLTDARLVAPGLLRGLPTGTVAAPVRIADPAAVDLLRAGDVIDVLAADAGPDGARPQRAPRAQVVARGVRVLTVPQPGEDAQRGFACGAGGGGAPPTQLAAELASAAAVSRLSLVLRG
jgi:pilus assembly protein CpaB